MAIDQNKVNNVYGNFKNNLESITFEEAAAVLQELEGYLFTRAKEEVSNRDSKILQWTTERDEIVKYINGK